MSDEIINKTIETLSKIIKKPPLNKKLLSKPPFRYLHDLFSEVIRASDDAFVGLYQDEEMNSENYKDKDSKVMYLTKMIEVLKLATGSNLKANPLKIVAGLDADDTNIMLQALGKVVLKKIDASKAIAAVVNPGGKNNETPASSAAPSPAPHIEREETVNNISTPPSAANAEIISEPLPTSHHPADAVENEDESRIQSHSKHGKQESHPSGKQTPEKPSRQAASKPDSARSRHEEQPEKDLHREPAPSMVPQANLRSRPMSARPPPPKIKSAIGADEEPASYVPVHIEQTGDDDDDFIVKAVDDAPKAQTEKADLLDGQHGGLVNKILQTKRDLEGKDGATATEKNKHVDNVNTGTKDLVSLRNSIQLLCQSTNPLGKTMDYLQEDADAMNTELAVWKKENAKYEQQAKEQQRLTKEAIKPLEDRLASIEKSIQEQLHKISILKGEILTNDSATEKVLKNIASAS